MVNPIHPAEISWNELGLPVANQFDDVYFSNDDGLAETRYVFLEKNHLPHRWMETSYSQFVIAESGFGSGLNFLALWHLFKQTPENFRPKRLHFISFEKYPLNKSDLIQTLAHWPELSDYAQQLYARYPDILTPGCQRIIFEAGQITLDLWFGDIHDSLKALPQTAAGLVDCWFLDGFAPSKNPQMWSQSLFDAMARLSRSGATLATFTAAGFVRRGLIEAGFDMHKEPGFGHKREMICGELKQQQPQPTAAPWFARPKVTEPTDIVIIGAGLAGASLSYALSQRGIKHRLYEQTDSPASAASGNRQGAIYPLLQNNNAAINEFFCSAFNYNRQILKQLIADGHPIRHQWCGVLQLGYDEKSQKKLDKLLAKEWPDTLLHAVDSATASSLLGQPVEHSGAFYPLAGWANPADLVQALLKESEKSGFAKIRYQATLDDFSRDADGITLSINGEKDHCQQLILANGHQMVDFHKTAVYPITPVRGQVTHLRENEATHPLKTVLCYDGYLTPAHQGTHCIGATYQRNQLSRKLSDTDTQTNLAALPRCIQQPWAHHAEVDDSVGRAAIRATLRDHLPMMGPMLDVASLTETFATVPQPKLSDTLKDIPLIEGVYSLAGLGARGVCSAPLLAELLACEITGEPTPVSQEVLDALHPARFWVRRLRRNQPILSHQS